jgi:hypothetical protein
MPRHTVDSTQEADDQLADLFVNAAPPLAAAIRDASNRIDRKLQYPDLIHSHRHAVEGYPSARRYVDNPLAVVYTVDAANRSVLIVRYEMAPPRLARP